MADYYGWVNRPCTLILRITEVFVDKFNTESQLIELHGAMWAKLYVNGANLDGSDQLAVEFNIPHANVNATAGVMTAPYFTAPHCYLDILNVVPNQVDVV